MMVVMFPRNISSHIPSDTASHHLQRHCESVKWHSVVEVNREATEQSVCSRRYWTECMFKTLLNRVYVQDATEQSVCLRRYWTECMFKTLLNTENCTFTECGMIFRMWYSAYSVWSHYWYFLICQKMKNWVILQFHSWFVLREGKMCEHGAKLERAFRHVHLAFRLVCYL